MLSSLPKGLPLRRKISLQQALPITKILKKLNKTTIPQLLHQAAHPTYPHPSVLKKHKSNSSQESTINFCIKLDLEASGKFGKCNKKKVGISTL